MRRIFAVLASAAMVASCATSPNNITPQYVSPMLYQGYTCEQISAELQRIGARVTEVTGQQQRAANNDALAMGVGLVIFWPALFFLANDNDKREELSRLRGEYDALQQAGTMKNCAAPQQTTATTSTAPDAAAPADAAPASTETEAPATAPAAPGNP